MIVGSRGAGIVLPEIKIMNGLFLFTAHVHRFFRLNKNREKMET